MTHAPTPAQALLLFGLLARHGACPQAELRPTVKEADRDALVGAKLVGVGKAGRGVALTLTDAGWAWAADHLSAELPPAQRALGDVLARLGAHLTRSGATLADVLGPKPDPESKSPAAGAAGRTAKPKPAKPKPAASGKGKATKPAARSRKAAPTQAALRKRVEAAYLALTGGQKNQSVRLARLRAELADLDRVTVDAALGRILKGDRKASLMRHDDPRQLDASDRDAAFAPGGEPFHLLWIAS